MRVFGRTITWWRVFGFFHLVVSLFLASPFIILAVVSMWFSKITEVVDACANACRDSLSIVVFFALKDVLKCDLVADKVRQSVLSKTSKYQYSIEKDVWVFCKESDFSYYENDCMYETRIL